MNNDKIAVGLDIGTTKIVAMLGKKNEYGKLEILGTGKSKSTGVARGMVMNIIQTTDSIQKAIKDAESNSGYKIKEVVVGIAGQHIRSIQTTDYIIRNNFEDVITDNDIQKLTDQVNKLSMLPGEEIIHVLPQEYKIDGEVTTQPMGMCGNRLEASFHVVVGQSASIRTLCRCVQNAGIELSGLTLEPLASSDSVLSEEEKEAGVVLIDIGGGTTDLAIFKDGIIRHTAVIPYGGNVITDDIKEGCTIIDKQAELLKVKFGSAWPGENKENVVVSVPGLRGREPKEISLKTLSRIINARVVEIIEQVFREIKNYGHEDSRKKLIAGIVLTGGGSQLQHIKVLVEYITGIDTRIGFPNEHLAGNTAAEISSPLYATAVGLVINSIERNNYGAVKIETEVPEKTIIQKEMPPVNFDQKSVDEKPENVIEEIPTKASATIKPKEKSNNYYFDKYFQRIKTFLDNAE